jgi:hypothetical protein
VTQLPLTESVRSLLKEQGRKLLLTARSVILESGKQSDDFAALVGVKPGQMSAALNDNGYHFALTWSPALLYIDKRRRFLAHQATMVGCRVLENEMTADEKVRRYEAAFRRAGVVGEAMQRDALDGDEP